MTYIAWLWLDSNAYVISAALPILTCVTHRQFHHWADSPFVILPFLGDTRGQCHCLCIGCTHSTICQYAGKVKKVRRTKPTCAYLACLGYFSGGMETIGGVPPSLPVGMLNKVKHWLLRLRHATHWRYNDQRIG